jgi:hypothetical protein
LRETITRVRSDWSGDVIADEKDAVRLTLTPGDGRKRPFVADLTEAEAEELKARGGREVPRRGRKPKP